MSRRPDAADVDAVLRFGRAALKAGDEEAAVAVVAEAARRDPGNARLWELLGLLHRGLDDLEPAIAAFERAAGLAPGDLAIAHGRARMHFEAGRPAAALFDRALALAPGGEPLLFGKVAATLAEQGLAAAIAALGDMLGEAPHWSAGHARLANLRWQSGDRDTFTDAIERALAEAPRRLNLWNALLVALTQAGRHEELRDAARRGREAAGPHLLFDAYEAVALGEMGDLDRAARLYAAMQPIRDPTVAQDHIRHLLRAGRIGEAAAEAEQWAETDRALFTPYLAIAWRLLGDARWQWLEGDPRLVGVYDIGEAAGPLDELARVLRSLHLAKARPLDQSVRGGTQTEGALFARPEPEIRRLRAALADAVRRHLAQLPPSDPAHPTLGQRRDRPIRFAGSWSVRLAGAGGHHASHRHPSGWFSSAFYVAVPGPAERGPKPAGWLSLGAPPAELGIDLPPTRLIEPVPGRLVLFPSTMWHGTAPFPAGERLTVAFDVAPPE